VTAESPRNPVLAPFPRIRLKIQTGGVISRKPNVFKRVTAAITSPACVAP
jgi:hypothetical protein